MVMLMVEGCAGVSVVGRRRMAVGSTSHIRHCLLSQKKKTFAIALPGIQAKHLTNKICGVN